MTLELAIKSIEELEHEVDTVIRAEFSELGDRLDEVIMLIRTTDRSDVSRLVSQMGRMQKIMELGTQCTCEAEARWHACLGRLSTAMEQAAYRYNVATTQAYCEKLGIPYDVIEKILEQLAPEQTVTDTLPPIPDNITIPDDPRDLTR